MLAVAITRQRRLLGAIGAGPLRRALENLIEDPMSEEILRGSFKGKDTLSVTLDESEDGKKLKFESSSKADAEAVAVGAPVEGGAAGA